MADSLPRNEERETLITALAGFGGLGVDEQSLVSMMRKWRWPEQRSLLRTSAASSSKLFKPDGHPLLYPFERYDDNLIRQLKFEFARFKETVVLWTMHPWERDARWANYVLRKAHPPQILVEISCARSSQELLGCRRAYHALYQRSLEEDVAHLFKGDETNLLVGLVSAYRYEGTKVHDDTARTEAKVLGNAIKNARAARPVDDEDVVRILSTRGKGHLVVTFKHYEEIHGRSIYEDLGDDVFLKDVVQCLTSPSAYFCKVINEALKVGADRRTKEALTRAVITRTDVDIEEIKQEYHKQYGASLEDVIAHQTRGSYRDALLSILGGGNIEIPIGNPT